MRGNRFLKLADRVVGVPLVAAMGMRPTRLRPPAVHRVGVLRTAAIGDTLLLSGPLADLRSALPDADIILITGSDNAQAGDLVARGRARHLAVSVRDPLGAVRTLRRERFDILIDTGAWPRFDASLAALSAARYSVGFRTQGQARHFAYDLAVEHSPRHHELENHRRLIRAALPDGRPIEKPHPPALLGVPPGRPASAPSGPYIVFHPWSGGYLGHLKEWPARHWVQLAEQLSDLGAMFVITGVRSNIVGSTDLVERLRAAGLSAESLAGELSLSEAAALLAGSMAVVSVNTGIMHLAAIIGAPTVCLDGPTPPHRWGPVGPRARSVSAALPGCGYLHLGFEYRGKRTDCMQGIDPTAVAQSVMRLLQEPVRSSDRS